MNVDTKVGTDPSANAAPATRAAAGEAAQVFKALGDPVRLDVFRSLLESDGEVCQCDLQPVCCVGQSTLSHHLKKLADAGLVDVARRGRWAYYTARPDRLSEVTAWLS